MSQSAAGDVDPISTAGRYLYITITVEAYLLLFTGIILQDGQSYKVIRAATAMN